MNESNRRAHAKWQADYFDEKAPIFVQPIPQDVRQRTRQIVEAAKLSLDARALDVGTGAGVLIEHFLEIGLAQQNIVGCDLSNGMLKEASQRYPAVTFWQGDIADFPLSYGTFDSVFFNACFGNLWEPLLVINHVRTLLRERGSIVISHPMGAGFVRELQALEKNLIPHLLPDRALLEDWCKRNDLRIETFIDEPNLYIAVLRAVA